MQNRVRPNANLDFFCGAKLLDSGTEKGIATAPYTANQNEILIRKVEKILERISIYRS